MSGLTEELPWGYGPAVLVAERIERSVEWQRPMQLLRVTVGVDQWLQLCGQLRETPPDERGWTEWHQLDPDRVEIWVRLGSMVEFSLLVPVAQLKDPLDALLLVPSVEMDRDLGIRSIRISCPGLGGLLDAR